MVHAWHNTHQDLSKKVPPSVHQHILQLKYAISIYLFTLCYKFTPLPLLNDADSKVSSSDDVYAYAISWAKLMNWYTKK